MPIAVCAAAFHTKCGPRLARGMGWIAALSGILSAQNLPPAGIMYTCEGGSSKLKVLRCSSGANAVCEVGFFGAGTPPEQSGSARMTRAQLAGLLRSCVLPNGQPAIVSARVPAPRVPAPKTGSAAPAVNAPFRVGDIAMAYSMFGWIQVRILEVRGNEYRIQYMDRSDMWVKASNLRRPRASLTRSGTGSVPPGGGKSGSRDAAEERPKR